MNDQKPHQGGDVWLATASTSCRSLSHIAIS